MNPKELVAKKIADEVHTNQTIGLGSGTTTELAVKYLGTRIRSEKLVVYGVPSSSKIGDLGSENGIVMLDLATVTKIDWAFDGADEVDANFNLIKGGGGCHLLEKLVAERAGGITVIITEDKLVEVLGAKFAVPLEVIPAAKIQVLKILKERFGIIAEVRIGSGKSGAVITDSGNIIIDVKFSEVDLKVHQDLKAITGVIETGIFCGLTKRVLVGSVNGVREILNPDFQGSPTVSVSEWKFATLR